MNIFTQDGQALIVRFAEESSEPPDEALWEHVYVNPIELQ